MNQWTVAYRDTDKTIERRDTGALDSMGEPVWEERVTYANTVQDGIRKQAAAALELNKMFLALDSPTNAQTLAEVKALARQVNALIRMELDDYSADA